MRPPLPAGRTFTATSGRSLTITRSVAFVRVMPDIAVAVVPGARTPQQIIEDVESMKVKIPGDFWAELKEEKLISENAPITEIEQISRNLYWSSSN